MATTAQLGDSNPLQSPTIQQWSRHAYLAITCILVATVIWGFWPSYWGPLFAGRVDNFWFIHLHATVFLGWMILLLVQALLVTRGNVSYHRKLGVAGMVYGVLVLCVGLFISIAAPVTRVNSGQMPPQVAELVAVYNLTDIVIFGGFFLLSMRYRSVPALHRRLVLCSTIALTGAAVGRVLPSGSLSYSLVWLTPLIFGFAIDLATDRRVHPAFLSSAVVFVAMFHKVQLFSMAPIARTVGHSLIRPFL